jgi:hypothetical protein
MWIMMINIPWWLKHIHIFLEKAVKKGIVDVELLHVPPLRDGEREDDMYSCRLDDGTICIIIVDAVTLLKPFGD